MGHQLSDQCITEPLAHVLPKEHANYFTVGFRANSVRQGKLCQIDQMHRDFNNQQGMMATTLWLSRIAQRITLVFGVRNRHWFIQAQ
jgi:hypothetical protein